MKNTTPLIAFTLLFFTANAQQDSNLPTVRAIGGGGTNINWPAIKIEDDKDGPGFFYNDCSQSVEVVRASSTLTGQGTKSYGIKNLSDQNPMSAWVEGKSDYGIGESFEVKSPGVNVMYNGYQSSPANWKNNSRVKKFKVYKDNKPVCYLILTDEMGAQRFELPTSKDYSWENPSVFKFEIVEVYKGEKWPDVAISEVDLVLCCFAKNTLLSSNLSTIDFSEVEKYQTISSVDLSTNEVVEAEIVKYTTQVHVNLLKVSTASKSIEITQDHPVYVNGYGFASLARMKRTLSAENYSDLINSIEILTWNSEKSELEYEKLIGVEVIEGSFETYSIMELSKGTNFIANGFVTKTY